MFNLLCINILFSNIYANYKNTNTRRLRKLYTRVRRDDVNVFKDFWEQVVDKWMKLHMNKKSKNQLRRRW